MVRFKFISKVNLEKLPKTSGIYAFFNKSEGILYLGKARNIQERVKNHFSQPNFKDALFLNQVAKIGFFKTDSEIETLILEANLIKKYQPKYNVVWRDDKNYFFVGITREDFPRIFWTHQTKVKSQKSKVKSDFVGPFVDGKALKQTLKTLRKVFPYRSCCQIPQRPCLWYHLSRCPAPCLLKTSFSRGQSSVNFGERVKKECQRNAKNLIKILKEGRTPVLNCLKKEMKLASKNQNFEEAAKIRDEIIVLEKIMEHAKIFDTETCAKFQSWPEIDEGWEEVEKELRKILGIEKRISRIEAYDVSNIQGKLATASMVTFIEGQPAKGFYRKFKIKISGKPDDIAMLKECLVRRFNHQEWGLPDLILIDGGKAQLNAARQSLESHFKQARNIPIMALAKKRSAAKSWSKSCFGAKRNELYIENFTLSGFQKKLSPARKEPILLKNLPRPVFNLILQLRDEAHRFAKKYHLKLRETCQGI